jgi:hypothetical protein
VAIFNRECEKQKSAIGIICQKARETAKDTNSELGRFQPIANRAGTLLTEVRTIQAQTHGARFNGVVEKGRTSELSLAMSYFAWNLREAFANQKRFFFQVVKFHNQPSFAMQLILMFIV